MAYEFMSLAEVEALPEVPENATVLAEVDGSIKRIPGNGLGGGKSLVIVESSFTDFYANTPSPKDASAPAYTYTANMEFADALAAFRACELTNAVLYTSKDGPAFLNCIVGDFGAVTPVSATDSSEPVRTIDCLGIIAEVGGDMHTMLYWTADGISTKRPSGEPG